MRPVYYVVYIFYLFLITFLIFFDRRKPMKRFGWILTLIFLPGLGLLLYWFFGSGSLSTHHKKKIRRRHGKTFKHLMRIVSETDGRFDTPKSKNIIFHQNYCSSIFTSDNNAEIYTTGAAKYKRLFEDIEAAQDNIHLMYFTIHNDSIGKRFINALIKKVQQGVEVKLLYDGFGCLATFIQPAVRKLRKAGGSALCIRPYTRTVNYRNHRKVVVIDGKVGYLGGMNIGDHYQDGVRNKNWRDTHVRVTGSMVHDLQKVFLSDWIASRKKTDIGLRHDLQYYFPLLILKVTLKHRS